MTPAIRHILFWGLLLGTLTGTPELRGAGQDPVRSSLELRTTPRSGNFTPDFLKLLTGQAKPIDDATAAGIKFLIAEQDKNGSWGKDATPLNSKGGAAGAITSFSWMALKRHADTQGIDKDKTKKAIDEARRYMLESLRIRPGFVTSYDKRHWNHAYDVLGLTVMYADDPSETVKTQVTKVIEALESGQEDNGGWSYTGASTTTKRIIDTNLSVTALLFLMQAKAAGLGVQDKTIEKGVKHIKFMRQDSGAYRYDQIKDKKKDSVVGSCSRAVPCELALYLAGESDQKKLQWAVGHFFSHRHLLEETSKKHAKRGNSATHVGPEDIAPYYLLWSYFFAVQALHHVDADARIAVDSKNKGETKTPAECLELLKKAVLDMQKSDGSWLDSGTAGFHYGTASALLILSGQRFIDLKK